MLLSIREFVNAVLLVADLALIFVFAAFLWGEVSQRGWHTLRSQAAKALLVYFTGMTVVRAWGFTLLWYEDINQAVNRELALPISLMGTALAMVGALMCVRVFSPGWWGPWGWIVTAVLAIGLGTFVYIR